MRAESLRRILWIFAAISLLQVFAARAGQPSSIQAKFDGFEKRTSELRRQSMGGDLSGQAYTHGIETAYSTAFSPHQTPHALAKLSTHEIELMFRAASTAAFYGNRLDYARDMALDLDELEHRQAASAAEYRDMFKTYVAARDFPAARALQALHLVGNVSALPQVTTEDAARGGIAVLAMEGNSRLVKKAINLESSDSVVVVAHPLCHFTQNAVADIDSDPVLKRLFNGSVTWLAPQDQTTDFTIFSQWNVAHPAHPMVIAYRQSAFPMIDDWDTPTFYFLHDGKVVARLTGWPEEGRKTELLGAFAKLKQTGVVSPKMPLPPGK